MEWLSSSLSLHQDATVQEKRGIKIRGFMGAQITICFVGFTNSRFMTSSRDKLFSMKRLSKTRIFCCDPNSHQFVMMHDDYDDESHVFCFLQ
jgi:hypothetical protein